VSSSISTDCTPGTQPPIFRMSLTNAQARAIGAWTSNVAVPSGIPVPQPDRCNILCSAPGTGSALFGLRPLSCFRFRSIRERGRGPPPFLPRRVGFARLDSAFPQERKARALVHADLPILRHFVHRFAAFRFPLAEEVDRYFRSLLQFHVSLLERPSLVRVRLVWPRASMELGYKKAFPPEMRQTERPR